MPETRARLVPAHRAHGASHPDLFQTPDLKARDLTAEERAQRSGKAGGGGAEGGGTVMRVGPPALGVLALLVVGVGLGVALSRR